MDSLTHCKSYFHWTSLLLLNFISTLCTFYRQLIASFLTCTVEVWGPKRFSSSKDDDETSYDIHSDRLYLQVLDYLSNSNLYDYHAITDLKICCYSADNYFKHNDSQKAPSLSAAKNPVTLGPPFNHPHHIQYKGEWLTIERIEIPQVSYFDYSYEKIKFTAKRHNRALIYDLLSNAVKSAKNKSSENDNVQLYRPKDSVCSCCAESWDEMGSPRCGRPLDSVILGDNVKERVVDDFQEFLKARDWYEQREIPYSRGYLLYGPPGCGKSSLIKSIASTFQHSICILSLSAKGLNDFTLSRHMNSAPEKSIILLEDIDSAFKSREDELAETSDQNLSFGGCSSSAVTFSGLLNALDGVIAGGTGGRIIFMTTNHVDRLDSALIRPGRIDMKICVDYATDSQIKQLYNRFYKDDNDHVEGSADEFVDCVRMCSGNVKVTMAMVQGLLLSHSIKRSDNNCKTDLYKDVKAYFKEQECSYNQRVKHNEWSMYV